MARAKEREREERLAALNKRQQDNIEELQRKIKMKVGIEFVWKYSHVLVDH